MNHEDSNYLVQQQRLLFENSKKEENGISKPCLVQTYSSSLKLLDNDDALNLLSSNLEKCLSITKTKEDIRFKCNNDEKWRSSLGSFNIETYLNPLPCTKNGDACENVEITQENIDEFMKYFQSSTVKQSFSSEPKSRKIAKSFAPRSCSSNKNFVCSSSIPKMDKKTLNADLIEENREFHSVNAFKTAAEELRLQNVKKYGNRPASQNLQQFNQQQAMVQKKQLGTRRTVRNKFVSPLLSHNSSEELSKSTEWPVDETIDERLKNIDPRMVELIRSEIMDNGIPVHWDDIAGLEFAKTAIQEAVVWPLLRPDIFTGLRKPPKGILLFGPPGTGKTLIGKCVASQSKSTFFSISASSLTSKWVGDGEKMVRALFEVARCHQPAVIFIDEIDSLLSQRSDSEHESSRRIKTEFLVRLDGATTDNDEQILLIGATNRPQELDEAARRRFVKRLYIPLPDFKARLQIIGKLMDKERHELVLENMEKISKLCDGYSGADMRNVCSEASMGPIRSIDMSMIQSIQPTQVRPVNMEDFLNALTRVKSSVSSNDLDQYLVWNKTYGSGF